MPNRNEPIKLIGLFGGSFDPIHYGHLAVGWEILQAAKLDKLIFIPAAVSPHKQAPKAAGKHRLEMLNISTASYPEFEVSDCELNRPAPSYTIDTINHFTKEYPGVRICLIIGYDAFLHLKQWHQFQDILAKVHLIVASRPNSDLNKGKQLDFNFSQEKLSRVALIDAKTPEIFHFVATQLDISATKIRNNFNNKQTPHFLMPAGVIQYIKSHVLY